MSYRDWTLQNIVKEFQLETNERDNLFAHVEALIPSEHLAITLRDNIPLALAINTEKARSELIIAPLLVEIRKIFSYQISLFSGIEFTIDAQRGLNGICDFMLTLSPEQFFVSAPVVVLVEAKNENIKSGIGQCIAEMYAARLFNVQEAQPCVVLYGVVTSGSVWKFLKLEEHIVSIDLEEYHISQAGKILGILRQMLDDAHAALAEAV